MRSWIGAVLAWTVALAAVAVVAVAVLVPRIAGATPYTVTTGSMRPGLSPGALAVVRPTAFEDLSVGDVITYQLESGEPTVATHRIVATGMTARGDRIVQTQGDANPRPDAEWVRAVQVRGELWYSVPHLGRVNTLLDPAQRQWAVYGVAALLLGYALVMWVGAVRDRTRPRKEDDDERTPRAPAQV